MKRKKEFSEYRCERSEEVDEIISLLESHETTMNEIRLFSEFISFKGLEEEFLCFRENAH